MGQSCSPANSTCFPLLRPCQLLVQSNPPGPLSPDHHSEVGVTRWKFRHALEDLTEFPHATRPCIQIPGLRKPHSAQTLRLHPHPPRLDAVTPSECFSLCLQTGPPAKASWTQILSLTPPGCVILGSLLYLLETPFPQL